MQHNVDFPVYGVPRTMTFAAQNHMSYDNFFFFFFFF